MGVRILYDRETNQANLYCSTSDWAFGPVFYNSNDREHDADERAEAFCRWLGAREPRRMSDSELEKAYHEWAAQEVAQWNAEELAASAPKED